MLKWLQYETVLGPETADDAEPAPHAQGAIIDIEKGGAVVDKGSSGGMVVTGPGLGDLLTEGPTQVFDLERHPGPLEMRLERIEALLNQLADRGGDSQGRISTATYVDDGMPAVGGGKVLGEREPEHGVASGHHMLGDSDGINATQNGQHAPFVQGVAGAAGRPHVDSLGNEMPY